MKIPSPLFLAGTLTLTWGFAAPASASPQPEGLTFDLAPLPASTAAAPPPPPQETPLPSAPPDALPIPPTAITPPLATGAATPAPAGLYGGDQSLAWGDNQWPEEVSQWLPAPPPTSTLPTAPTAVAAVSPAPPPSAIAPPRDTVAITLDVAPATAPPLAEAAVAPANPPPEATAPPQDALTALFAGGVESVVARAVGSAEGTRTPEGHRTPAYYGHVDPGNGVWNLGTFSYQHGAASPEEADTRQLARLQRQAQTLKAQAAAKGLTLSERELVNGIDLANQAPLAALGRGGYVDWLGQARQLSMAEGEAIVWARTRSFLDPDTQRWNAPGLGNTVQSITHDQARRAGAIDRALALGSGPAAAAPSLPPLPGDQAQTAAFAPPRIYGPGEAIP